MKIINLSDQENLIPTTVFPYLKYPFDKFNKVQSRAFEIHDKDANCIVSAKTGVGKTIIGEMFLSHEINVRKGKGVYIAPFRALANERYDDWTSNHEFSKYKISICTGDFRLNSSRKKELEEADLIIATNELINSKLRNFKSENNSWLLNCNTICVDELHLLSSKGRGSHTENAIIKISEINNKARILGLSATMPNAKQIGEW